MFKCYRCKWYGNDESAGLINNCFNEELTEGEHDKYRNKCEGECPYFEEYQEIYSVGGHIPNMCYLDYGQDLDGCSTQQREGCRRCILYRD